MKCQSVLLVFLSGLFIGCGKNKNEKIPFDYGYIAFSLKVAHERISNSEYDQLPSNIYFLAGITNVTGLVYDVDTGDIILVGKRDTSRVALTLDDFVVALRARFIYNEWPAVSIDPVKDTEKTGLQVVRYEGGIENTQYGNDLFVADYKLKEISFGILDIGILGLESYWGLIDQDIYNEYEISSRFWFYPLNPGVVVRENVVAIEDAKVGVFTEVLAAKINGEKINDLSNFNDNAGQTFAKSFTDRFDEITKQQPLFLRLQGLNQLVALTKALEDMEHEPDLSFWLKDYRVKEIRTKKDVQVLKRNRVRTLQRGQFKQWLSGGVQLMAIALRLNAGDITAYREAVIKTRPSPDSLSWGFLVGEDWVLPTDRFVETEDNSLLFIQANFLSRQKRYEDAILLYNKIAKSGEEVSFESRFNKAIVLRQWGIATLFEGGEARIEEAILLLKECIEMNHSEPSAYYELGTTYYALSKIEEAIREYEKALEVDPNWSVSFFALGRTYYRIEQNEKAVALFEKYLAYDSSSQWAIEARTLIGKIEESKKYKGSGTKAETIKYINDEWNFSFEYSSQWTVLTRQEAMAKIPEIVNKDTQLIVFNEREPSENLNIQTTRVNEPPPSIAEFEQGIKLMDRYLPEQMPGSRKVSARVIDLTGVKAMEYVLETSVVSLTLLYFWRFFR